MAKITKFESILSQMWAILAIFLILFSKKIIKNFLFNFFSRNGSKLIFGRQKCVFHLCPHLIFGENDQIWVNFEPNLIHFCNFFQKKFDFYFPQMDKNWFWATKMCFSLMPHLNFGPKWSKIAKFSPKFVQNLAIFGIFPKKNQTFFFFNFVIHKWIKIYFGRQNMCVFPMPHLIFGHNDQIWVNFEPNLSHFGNLKI